MKEILIQNYGIIAVIIAILMIIWGIYSNVKFACLKKASEMVAKAESHSELSGEEKFSLCLLWINNDLPKLFKNKLFQAVISYLINYAYNNSFDYMKNYVKRKTGKDISEITDQLKEIVDENK